MAFTPAMGAFLVRRWVTGEGLAGTGLGWRASRSLWLSAWLAPLVITALMLALAAAAGWWRFDLGPVDGAGGVMFLLVTQVVLTPVYFGEEFGWTSFLWPRLVPGRPRLSMLLTGSASRAVRDVACFPVVACRRAAGG
ncbi:hypothetical protein Apa02nite_083920 [Actinoplanes palleronii]|uniref:CPBP family intramembrane metalloprotease n=2 Tax=Actinoplanes palleronii TaxID=113570 RepID=A0ABQ4BNN0_9ACTN|nr:hypothetical protein Apa02nite_083920 [Actinoplanes palleronii]